MCVVGRVLQHSCVFLGRVIHNKSCKREWPEI